MLTWFQWVWGTFRLFFFRANFAKSRVQSFLQVLKCLSGLWREFVCYPPCFMDVFLCSDRASFKVAKENVPRFVSFRCSLEMFEIHFRLPVIWIPRCSEDVSFYLFLAVVASDWIFLVGYWEVTALHDVDFHQPPHFPFCLLAIPCTEGATLHRRCKNYFPDQSINLRSIWTYQIICTTTMFFFRSFQYSSIISFLWSHSRSVCFDILLSYVSYDSILPL